MWESISLGGNEGEKLKDVLAFLEAENVGNLFTELEFIDSG